MMKIDVEGYEVAVLRGATATLANPELHAMVVELNGAGGSYGFTDDEIHNEVMGYGFRPYRYDPESRSLHELSIYNHDDLNTLYCRADDVVRERLATAEKIEVRGQAF